ncbi:MAG TPA: DsrE family protein [Xanthomonadales bacterium]|nr:DsrE family protein [Xanthomonadales bacterium]
MRFALLVLDGPLVGPACRSALAFAHALRSDGHVLEIAFFHGEGARAALAPADAAERLTESEWMALAGAGVPLLACATALERRGLRAGSRAVVPGSLGQLMAALDRVDRVVTFAN